MADFDAREAVDNESQQAAFEELVKAVREPRVFIVNDEREGCGKTTLLQKLRHNCRRSIKCSVSLVDLEDHETPDEYSLVEKIGKEIGDSLTGFTKLNRALKQEEIGPFREAHELRSAYGVVDARGAQVGDGGQVGGAIFNNPQIQHYHEAPPKQWTAEFREEAEGRVVEAFIEDLYELPPEAPAVIMIDSMDDKAKSRDLRDWVQERLLEDVFLQDPDARPKNAILCLAGRGLRDYRKDYDPDDWEKMILAPELLTEWEERHTKAFVRLVLKGDAAESAVKAIHDGITSGSMTLARATQVAILFGPRD